MRIINKPIARTFRQKGRSCRRNQAHFITSYVERLIVDLGNQHGTSLFPNSRVPFLNGLLESLAQGGSVEGAYWTHHRYLLRALEPSKLALLDNSTKTMPTLPEVCVKVSRRNTLGRIIPQGTIDSGIDRVCFFIQNGGILFTNQAERLLPFEEFVSFIAVSGIPENREFLNRQRETFEFNREDDTHKLHRLRSFISYLTQPTP